MYLIILVLISFAGKASTLDDRAQMLLSARDVKSLKIKINSMNGLKKTEVACGFELSSEMIPKSCYRLKHTKEKEEILDQACERASLKINEPVSLVGLSKRCADFVNKKNKDIQYTQSEASPEDVLR